MFCAVFCAIADIITDALIKVFRFPELVTVLISVLPIVEARGAVPIAIGYGIHPFFAFLYAFIGSSLMAPILIAVLLPFVKWLSKTKLFRKIGETLYDKFEQKAAGINGDADSSPVLSRASLRANATSEASIASDSSPVIASDSSPVIARSEATKQSQASNRKKSDFKKMLGVFAFVAIPLPLTGVWTGSAVAAVTRLPYIKALAAVIAGNLVATSIITVLCFFFSAYIDIIILVIGIIAILAVIALIVKIILHKSPDGKNKEQQK